MAHIDSKMAHETTKNNAGQIEMTCTYPLHENIYVFTDLGMFKSMHGSIASLQNA